MECRNAGSKNHIACVLSMNFKWIEFKGSQSECEFQIAGDLWPVEANLGQISQVISNIVINANQAMPEGGIIRIAAENMMLEIDPEIKAIVFSGYSDGPVMSNYREYGYKGMMT